ncbi:MULTISPECIES: hypothetical protein [Pseudomonas]|uniref:hypothetical protein n=1 Tax=Pseudomonas TaxID=286 RepID=UPI0012D47241|nr:MULTISPECIES: hypothetical protein [Pseudomonas]QXE10542.1 hypothetical protein GTQ41_16235 [Pseudomonas sp. AN-B15]
MKIALTDGDQRQFSFTWSVGQLVSWSVGQLVTVGAAEGCDLLILSFTIKIKRSQPSAAPTFTSCNGLGS